MIKTYVLDTNILMSSEGQAIFGFDDNKVILLPTVLEELDGLKEAPGETGYQARECLRKIKSLKEAGKENKETIITGITLENKGKLIAFTDSMDDLSHLNISLPDGWSLNKPDNRIIASVMMLLNKHENAILITNDGGMELKAEMANISVQNYLNDQIDVENEYTGRKEIYVGEDFITGLYSEKALSDDEICNDLQPNEFVTLKDALSRSALAWKKNNLIKLIQNDKDEVFGVIPKNSAQRFALAALTAPQSEIPFVILKGPAGCGKTFLALAAALDKTYVDQRHKKNRDTDNYEKIVICRSNSLSDNDQGFLPGDLDAKMTPLLAPFFDNLEHLIGKDEEDKSQVKVIIEDLFEDGIIEMGCFAYIRGRSMANTFLIVDEAQNLTRGQAKTLLTRVAEGAKIIVMGDPEQIDNPKLDKKNNGLVYLSEGFKGSKLCAQVEFTKDESVRCPLVLEALERLK